jgi:hypothetical protein
MQKRMQAAQGHKARSSSRLLVEARSAPRKECMTKRTDSANSVVNMWASRKGKRDTFKIVGIHFHVLNIPSEVECRDVTCVVW